MRVKRAPFWDALDEPSISWSQRGDAPAGEAEPVTGDAKEAADEAILLALSAALGLEPDVAGPVLVEDRGREALHALVGRAAAQGFDDAIELLHGAQEEAETSESSASALAEHDEEEPEADAQAAAEQPTVAPAAAEQPTVPPAAAEQPTVAQAAGAQADVAPAVWRRVGNDVLAPDGSVLGTVHSVLAPDGRTRSLKATCKVHPARTRCSLFINVPAWCIPAEVEADLVAWLGQAGDPARCSPEEHAAEARQVKIARGIRVKQPRI